MAKKPISVKALRLENKRLKILVKKEDEARAKKQKLIDEGRRLLRENRELKNRNKIRLAKKFGSVAKTFGKSALKVTGKTFDVLENIAEGVQKAQEFEKKFDSAGKRKRKQIKKLKKRTSRRKR